MPTATAAIAAGSFLLSSNSSTIANTTNPRIKLTAESGNMPATPDKNKFRSTISSMPFFKKTSPRASWIPLTTGWVNSLASLSTNPVSENSSKSAPKITPDAPITDSVIWLGKAIAMAPTAFNGWTGTGKRKKNPVAK